MATTSKPVGLRPRCSFARNPEVIEVPDLIKVQKESYDRFLQRDTAPDKRADTGLHGIFKNSGAYGLTGAVAADAALAKMNGSQLAQLVRNLAAAQAAAVTSVAPTINHRCVLLMVDSFS